MVSAFSVPKSKREEKIQGKPGPGQYNPQNSPKVVKPTDPKYSFGKQGRQEQVSKVPGPGSYDGKSNFVKDKYPSYSLGGRKQQSPGKYNVGPGQYEPGYNFPKDKSPSYSLYGRGSTQLKGNKVGPGEYQIKAQLDVKKSGYQFTKDRRQNIDKRAVPGPGSYDYENAVFKYGSKEDPKYGFGSRIKDPSTLQVPGPGQYDGKVGLYSRIGGIMGRQMRNSYGKSQTPGPGNYNHDFTKVRNHDPSWSLSKEVRGEMSKSAMVGPGSYDYDKNYKSLVTNNKGYNFGSQKKLSLDVNPFPGPGTYNGDGVRSKKAVKIGERLSEMSKSQVPGPGSYENQKYDHSSWMVGKGRYSVGRGIRDGNYDTKIPGPGSYESNDHKSFRGKVTFGKDLRLKNEKNLNPGPGEYSLKPTFADVPKYLLPDKS